MILATCSLDEARNFNGRLVSGGEKVMLNLKASVADMESACKELVGNNQVYCVTLDGWNNEVLPEVPESKKGRVFITSSLEGVREIPSGYTQYLVLPKGYSDMRKVYDVCMKYPNVRVSGGNLLEIPGVRIGRTDDGKDKMSSSFNGIYDAFLEIDLKDLDNLEVIKSRLSKRDLDDISGSDIEKEKHQKSNSGSKNSGSKVVKSIGSAFGSLFSGEEVDF